MYFTNACIFDSFTVVSYDRYKLRIFLSTRESSGQFFIFLKEKESDKIREGKRIIVRNNDACVPENGLDVFHFVARCWIVISSSCFTSLSYRVSVKGCFFGSIRCSVSRGNVEWNERYFVCRV